MGGEFLELEPNRDGQATSRGMSGPRPRHFPDTRWVCPTDGTSGTRVTGRVSQPGSGGRTGGRGDGGTTGGPGRNSPLGSPPGSAERRMEPMIGPSMRPPDRALGSTDREDVVDVPDAVLLMHLGIPQESGRKEHLVSGL